MKIVTLSGPTSVDTGNPPRGYSELRHPIEGSFTVSDEEAERLKTSGMLASDPEDLPKDEDAESAEPEIPEDLRDLKLDELKAKALKDGVPLHDAKTKPTIIAAFVAHRAPQA